MLIAMFFLENSNPLFLFYSHLLASYDECVVKGADIAKRIPESNLV